MSDLLDLAMAAHGGLARWREVSTLSVRGSLTGQMYGIKRQPQGMADVLMHVDVREPAVAVSPFGGPGHVGHFRSERTWITDGASKTIEECLDPRASFAGHVLASPWDPLQLLYFNAYAMWNYLSTPFLFTRPGFVLRELEPHRENGDTWRRLQVTFPDDIPSHCREQVFYFDDKGLLQRIDYVTDVAGGVAAHYCLDHAWFGGASLPDAQARRPPNAGRPEAGAPHRHPHPGQRHPGPLRPARRRRIMNHDASLFTADAAPTRFVETDGLRLAYRVIGPEQAPPLVLAMRFRGVMDEWDPAFLDALAAKRRVYWFDSAGIGLSSGETPDSIPGMARVLIGFIEALGLRGVDLFGWSMGGYVVQSATLARPDLVRRLIVAGSGPGGVPDAPAPPAKVWEIAAKPVNDDADFLYLFFPETPEGVAAGRRHMARLGRRAEASEPGVRPRALRTRLRPSVPSASAMPCSRASAN